MTIESEERDRLPALNGQRFRVQHWATAWTSPAPTHWLKAPENNGIDRAPGGSWPSAADRSCSVEPHAWKDTSMRHVSPAMLAAFLSAFVLVAPTATHAEQATAAAVTMAPASSPAPDATADPNADDHRLYAVGAGAIVGVVAFNMLTYPFGSVPFVAGALAQTPVDIALGSRLVAAVVSGAGALAAHYLYTAYPDANQATRQ